MMLRGWTRGAVAVCVAAGAMATSGCGGEEESAYACFGGNDTCVISFSGADSADLSDEIGEGATFRFEEADGNTALIAIDGEQVKLTRGREQNVSGFAVEVTELQGSEVKLRIQRR